MAHVFHFVSSSLLCRLVFLLHPLIFSFPNKCLLHKARYRSIPVLPHMYHVFASSLYLHARQFPAVHDACSTSWWTKSFTCAAPHLPACCVMHSPALSCAWKTFRIQALIYDLRSCICLPCPHSLLTPCAAIFGMPVAPRFRLARSTLDMTREYDIFLSQMKQNGFKSLKSVHKSPITTVCTVYCVEVYLHSKLTVKRSVRATALLVISSQQAHDTRRLAERGIHGHQR